MRVLHAGGHQGHTKFGRRMAIFDFQYIWLARYGVEEDMGIYVIQIYSVLSDEVWLVS